MMSTRSSSPLPPSSPPPRRRPPANANCIRDDDERDRAVRRTADDAILHKLSCVEWGYYDDPFARSMARGASGLVDGGRGSGASFPSSSFTEPIIRKGTHARVRAVDRAIDAFLSLPLPSSCGKTPRSDSRQVVVLGAGRDTSYLRRRFGDGNVTLNGVRWYEVDHPSVIRKKVCSLLPSCVPCGYTYECHQHEDGDDSYAVSIASPTPDESFEELAVPSYHLIGMDLRFPDALVETLAHPKHGYDRSAPTLFVLECVLMYLPDDAARDLLRCLAESPSKFCDASLDPFVAVAIYDPIPSDDRFGRLMVENLRRAGVMGNNGRRRNDCARTQLSVERTLSLSDQLARLIEAGFDIAAGCDMMDVHDYGVMSADDRWRAAQCEMLDEIEEFVMLMRHYCFLIGVCSKNWDKRGGNGSVGFSLCSARKDSPIGFKEGHCTVLNRSINGNKQTQNDTETGVSFKRRVFC